MRIIVFFDLPVKTAKEKKIYTTFRRNLIKDGYFMIQYSVYGRLCNGVDSVDKYTERLQKIIPSVGSVRVLTVTEKQYASIKIFAGEKKKREKSVNAFQLSFFLKRKSSKSQGIYCFFFSSYYTIPKNKRELKLIC